ncbi:MAG: AraC family transcriptional regulator [Clostridia bacterium]
MSQNNNYSRLVQKCILYIETDYMYILGVDDIAQTLNVSKSHLIREFSKEVGITPNKYLVAQRLSQAKILLLNEDVPIESIAEAVGFSCGNYFSKVFKKEYGITPREYIANTPVINPSKVNGRIYL